jgi:hypothetical protein
MSAPVSATITSAVALTDPGDVCSRTMTPAHSGSKTRRLAFSRFFAQISKHPARYRERRYHSLHPQLSKAQTRAGVANRMYRYEY